MSVNKKQDYPSAAEAKVKAAKQKCSQFQHEALCENHNKIGEFIGKS